MWFFQELIRREIYSRIDCKFLVAGHTYSPTDGSFGVIECYTSRTEAVYTPYEWFQHQCDRDGTKCISKLSSTPQQIVYRTEQG